MGKATERREAGIRAYLKARRAGADTLVAECAAHTQVSQMGGYSTPVPLPRLYAWCAEAEGIHQFDLESQAASERFKREGF